MSTNPKDLLTTALDNLKKREEQFQFQQDEIKRLQAELTAKYSEIQKVQETLKARNAEIQTLKTELTAKNNEINQIKAIGANRSTIRKEQIKNWGIDYSHLEELLLEQQWQAANTETAQKMLEVMGRTETGYLREEDIHRFPGKHFNTIDALWVKYSQGRFGFSVQKHILESMGANVKKIDYNQFRALISRLGWAASDGKEWLGGRIFDLTAPPGHLPEIASHIQWKDAQFYLTKVIIRLRGYRGLFNLLKHGE